MISDKYIPTIGLEIHAELKTLTKMFCSCANRPNDDKPNIHVCPICLGHPGSLPVLNIEAIRNVLRVGIAVGGNLADFTEWDRKNYFYPDIPKGYQISQYKYPLISSGKISGIELERIHLEEDTAQSTHDLEDKDNESVSLLNFNRAGVPLMELVTKPVIHDAKTAVSFAKELQLLLRYLNAGDANMEKGEMRVEANISIASPSDTDQGRFGTKTEVKNLNSFRAVEKAILYEIDRQTILLDSGEKVIQETRGWDDKAMETYSQRSKESSHDYRYFPDPDLPKLLLSEIPSFKYEILKKDLPELPWIKRDRYKTIYGMTDKEVSVFIDSSILANYYEKIVSNFSTDTKRVKLTTNYLLTDYLKLVKDALSLTLPSTSSSEQDSSISTDHKFDYNNSIPANTFAELITMISVGDINSRAAKDILALLFIDTKASAKAIAVKNGLIQKSDASDLIPAIDKVIADNAQVVAEYKGGKLASLQFLIGQAMKATKGSGNPEVVKKLLLERLS